MLQISNRSLPKSLVIWISGLNSVYNTALLYPTVQLDGLSAVRFLLLGINPQKFIKPLADYIMKAAASKE